MKKRHLLVSLLLLFCCFVTLSPRLLAVSYSIKEVNIDYQIKDDGTAEVKESYLYNFSGSHKGLIYQLDPTALYQVPEGVTFHLDGQAVVENGSKQKGTYTREVRSKMWRYKLYYPGKNDRVKMEVSYRLPHLITSYADTAELNRRLIGSKWEEPLHNITAKIQLPSPVSKEDLDKFRVFAHGDGRGEIKRGKDGQTISLTLPYNPRGQFMEAHLLFPTSLVPNNPNQKNEAAFDRLLQQEKAQAQEDARKAKRRAQWQQRVRQLAKPLFLIASLITGACAWLIVQTKRQQKRALERFPHIPAHLYEAPSDLDPITLSVGLFDDKMDGTALSAGLLNLVRQKIIAMTPYTPEKIRHKTSRKKTTVEFCLTLLVDKASFKSYPKIEQILLTLLFDKVSKGETRVTTEQIERYAQRSPKRFLNQLDKIKNITLKEVNKRNFLYQASVKESSKQLITKSLILLMIIITSLYVLIRLIMTGEFITASNGFIAVLLVLGLALLFTPLHDRLSDKGLYEKRQWEAFAQMLKDIAHLDRAKSASIVLFESYLVYAVVLGQAETVVKEMAKIFPTDVLAESNLAAVTSGDYLRYRLFSDHLSTSYSTAKEAISNSSGSNISGYGGGFSGGSSFGSGGGGGGGAF